MFKYFAVVMLLSLFLISCGDDDSTPITCESAASNVWNVMGSSPFDGSCGGVQQACIEDMEQDCLGNTGSYGAWTQAQINCIALGNASSVICDCGNGTHTEYTTFCAK